jgi:nitrite reductase/ring-hydroxylating ferredoxin subunit
MSEKPVLDLTRALCALKDVPEGGSRGFTLGKGDWPLEGLLVRVRGQVCAYLNRCPHAGHPLNLVPHRFLTADGSMIVCNSHGALFEKQTGYCVAGPCVGAALRAVPLRIEADIILLADDYPLPEAD